MKMPTAHMIYITGPKRYAALVITDYAEKAIPYAFAQGKQSGALPDDATLYMYADAYMYMAKGDLTDPNVVEENRWDFACYTPENRMFWELLAGNAQVFGISTSQDFIDEMARWSIHHPDEARAFVEHALNLPEQIRPDNCVLDLVFDRVEMLLAPVSMGARH